VPAQGAKVSAPPTLATAPRMTMCSPPATTLSLADTRRTRDTCLPLLPLPRSPVRWLLARSMDRVQVAAWQCRRRPRATPALAATAPVRLAAEGPLDHCKGRFLAALRFSADNSVHGNARVAHHHVAVPRDIAGGGIADQLRLLGSQLLGRRQHHRRRTVSAHADIGLMHRFV
jgi:hypothetical protein